MVTSPADGELDRQTRYIDSLATAVSVSFNDNNDYVRARESFSRTPIRSDLPSLSVVDSLPQKDSTVTSRTDARTGTTELKIKREAGEGVRAQEWSVKLDRDGKPQEVKGPDGVTWTRNADRGGWTGKNSRNEVVGQAKDVHIRQVDDGGKKDVRVTIRGDRETTVHDSTTGRSYIDRRDVHGRGVVLVKDGDKPIAAVINNREFAIKQDAVIGDSVKNGTLLMPNPATGKFDRPTKLRINADESITGDLPKTILTIRPDGTVEAKAYRSDADKPKPGDRTDADKAIAKVTTLPDGGRVVKVGPRLEMHDQTGNIYKSETGGMIGVYRSGSPTRLEAFKGKIDEKSGAVTEDGGRRVRNGDGSVTTRMDGGKELTEYKNPQYSIMREGGRITQINDDKGQPRYKITYDATTKEPTVKDGSGRPIPLLARAEKIQVGKTGDITAMFSDHSRGTVLHPDGAVSLKNRDRVVTTFPDRHSVTGDMTGRITSVKDAAGKEVASVQYDRTTPTRISQVTVNGRDVYRAGPDTQITMSPRGELTIEQTNPKRTIVVDGQGKETATYKDNAGRPLWNITRDSSGKPLVATDVTRGAQYTEGFLRTRTSPGTEIKYDPVRATLTVTQDGRKVFQADGSGRPLSRDTRETGAGRTDDRVRPPILPGRRGDVPAPPPAPGDDTRERPGRRDGRRDVPLPLPAPGADGPDVRPDSPLPPGTRRVELPAGMPGITDHLPRSHWRDLQARDTRDRSGNLIRRFGDGHWMKVQGNPPNHVTVWNRRCRQEYDLDPNGNITRAYERTKYGVIEHPEYQGGKLDGVGAVHTPDGQIVRRNGFKSPNENEYIRGLTYGFPERMSRFPTEHPAPYYPTAVPVPAFYPAPYRGFPPAYNPYGGAYGRPAYSVPSPYYAGGHYGRRTRR